MISEAGRLKLISQISSRPPSFCPMLLRNKKPAPSTFNFLLLEAELTISSNTNVIKLLRSHLEDMSFLIKATVHLENPSQKKVHILLACDTSARQNLPLYITCIPRGTIKVLPKLVPLGNKKSHMIFISTSYPHWHFTNWM